MPLDLGRVHKEIKDIDRDKASGVTIELKADSIQHLLGSFQGTVSVICFNNFLPIVSSIHGDADVDVKSFRSVLMCSCN